jgi:hypothetical protein
VSLEPFFSPARASANVVWQVSVHLSPDLITEAKNAIVRFNLSLSASATRVFHAVTGSSQNGELTNGATRQIGSFSTTKAEGHPNALPE